MIVIILVIAIALYLLGYINGYRQCEDIMQVTIHRIIKDCEEKKIHKIQEPIKKMGEEGEED